MNESLQTQYGYAGTGLAADRQRVLRNTYWLLALSLVPTVLGACSGAGDKETEGLSAARASRAKRKRNGQCGIRESKGRAREQGKASGAARTPGFFPSGRA